jgi:hypothetical protein
MDMQEHLEAHEQVQRFECQQCGHVTESKKHLREHVVSHHSMIACDIPGCSFTTWSTKLELQLHKNSVHSNLQHGCRLWGEGFKECKDLKQHRIKFHETGVPGVLKCSSLNCMQTFTLATDLSEHFLTKHWDSLNCACDVPWCNLAFKSKELLVAHKNKVHYRRLQLQSICQLCGHKFDSCLKDRHMSEVHKKWMKRRFQRKCPAADTRPVVVQPAKLVCTNKIEDVIVD